MLIGALAGGDQISGPVWVPSAPPSLENYLAPTLQPIPLLPAIAVLMGLLYLSGMVAMLWNTVMTVRSGRAVEAGVISPAV